MPKVPDQTAQIAPCPSHITLSLRLPASLHALLRVAADRHRRSLTQEIIVGLEAYAERIAAES